MTNDQVLYLKDCYLKEWETKVKSVSKGKFIVLKNTAFYPKSGGQPWDTGKITKDDEEYKVVYVGKFGGNISHEVDKPGLKPGDKVKCKIDWERRYTLMKMHTAAHVLSRVMYNESGATTSGNKLGVDRSRIDFALDDFDKEKIKQNIEKTNQIIAKKLSVEKKFMSKEQAMKLEGFAGPSPHLMKEFDRLRVVIIKGFDSQPCGGTHLDNIEEIGAIEFIKASNKGKNNRRVYYKLKNEN
ncbi:MAG: Alanyl-tRNA editing protein AlaX-M [Candidatus Woesearchaeota archaeon]|nr:Alanyl-tRNA editing protein AlaX-M [Candidatus Woesearchaeota archaeon]